MKVKLTPALAYVIGMWSVRPSRAGIGVHGLPHVCEYFIKGVLDAGLMPSSKILLSGKNAYFYHSGYKRFFSDVDKDLENKFRHKNAYSAAFLAGVFDATGRIEDEVPKLYGLRLDKQLLIERLGFRLLRKEKYHVPTPPREFMDFIKPYAQALQSGNERDPRS